MDHIQTYVSVLSTVYLTTRLKQDGKMTCDVSHLYYVIQPTLVYERNYISGHK